MRPEQQCAPKNIKKPLHLCDVITNLDCYPNLILGLKMTEETVLGLAVRVFT